MCRLPVDSASSPSPVSVGPRATYPSMNDQWSSLRLILSAKEPGRSRPYTNYCTVVEPRTCPTDRATCRQRNENGSAGPQTRGPAEPFDVQLRGATAGAEVRRTSPGEP
ncbi:hypothetical protein GCM10023317_48060 [Actinopolymorpha pittospori]